MTSEHAERERYELTKLISCNHASEITSHYVKQLISTRVTSSRSSLIHLKTRSRFIKSFFILKKNCTYRINVYDFTCLKLLQERAEFRKSSLFSTIKMQQKNERLNDQLNKLLKQQKMHQQMQRQKQQRMQRKNDKLKDQINTLL